MKPSQAGHPIHRAHPPYAFHPVGICFCLCLCLCLTGCSRPFFTFHGEIQTTGPTFGTWSVPPQGCSRAPIDGLPAARSTTLATFFWQDPGVIDARYRNHERDHAPDYPEQLNLIHTASGNQVRIQTIKNAGGLLLPKACTTLQIDTHDQPPALPGGRPSLAGTVHLSCTANQSHLQADFTFTRCDY